MVGGGSRGLGPHDTVRSKLCCNVRSGRWGSLESHYFPERRLKVRGPGWSQGQTG